MATNKSNKTKKSSPSKSGKSSSSSKENAQYINSNDNSPERYEASAAALSGQQKFEVEIIDPAKIEKYLLTHPVVPFGIDKKSNRIINRSYDVVGGSDNYRKYCQRILENSGGEVFLKNWIKDAYAFGNGFAKLAKSKDGDEIVKCVQKHPVYYGIYKEPITKKTNNIFANSYEDLMIAFDNTTGYPKGFCPYVYEGSKRRPVKDKFVEYDKVAHLKFNTWGDEIEGVSIVQFIHENIKQLIKIEKAGAEQLYRNGFTQKKFTTNIRSREKLKEFSKSIQNMNEHDSIVLLDGTDVQTLQPGNSDFVPFHKEFLNLIAIALGIPTALLTLDGQDVNRSTMSEMRSEMYQDSYADELIVKKTIDKEIFRPACEFIDPNVKDEDIPEFVFKKRKIEIGEEYDLKRSWSEIVANVSRGARDLYASGQTESANKLLESLENFQETNDQPIQGTFEDKRDNKDKSKGLFNKNDQK